MQCNMFILYVKAHTHTQTHTHIYIYIINDNKRNMHTIEVSKTSMHNWQIQYIINSRHESGNDFITFFSLYICVQVTKKYNHEHSHKRSRNNNLPQHMIW